MSTVDCALSCQIPDGWKLADVPEPRHAWPDVVGCPNDGCGRWFLAMQIEPSPSGPEKPQGS